MYAYDKLSSGDADTELQPALVQKVGAKSGTKTCLPFSQVILRRHVPCPSAHRFELLSDIQSLEVALMSSNLYFLPARVASVEIHILWKIEAGEVCCASEKNEDCNLRGRGQGR